MWEEFLLNAVKLNLRNANMTFREMVSSHLMSNKKRVSLYKSASSELSNCNILV